MTTMDRLADLLGDVDELLEQADAQTITESLDRGEAPDHLDVDHTCPWCGHGFHGLPCAPPSDYGPARSSDVFAEIDTYAEFLTAPEPDWACRCDSALPCPDDTWRPPAWGPSHYELLWVMDETGMDGWAAAIERDRRRRTQAEDALRARQEAADLRLRERRNLRLCRHMDATGLDGWAAQADRTMPAEIDADALKRFFTDVGASINAAMEAFADVAQAVGSALLAGLGTSVPRQNGQGATVSGVRIPGLLIEIPEPTPQERALQLRRTRNTGPERPTAGRARRPRRHGG